MSKEAPIEKWEVNDRVRVHSPGGGGSFTGTLDKVTETLLCVSPDSESVRFWLGGNFYISRDNTTVRVERISE